MPKFLSNLDVDASADVAGGLVVGANQAGHDVKFFGATDAKYMLWHESSDTLKVEGLFAITGDCLLNGDVTGIDTLTVVTLAATDYGLVSGDIPDNAANTTGTAATVTTAAQPNITTMTGVFGTSNTNGVVTSNGDGTVTTEASVTIETAGATTPTLLLNSSALGPKLKVRNENNSGVSPEFWLTNQRGSTAVDGVDGDFCGNIYFSGFDDGTPSSQVYAAITSEMIDTASGAERGSLELKVAEYDGGPPTTGLKLEGQDQDGEIDVTIGAGAASTTTIAGDLTVTTNLTAASRKYELPTSTVGDFKGGDIYYYGDGSTVKGGIYYISGTNWTLADADTESSASGLLAVALGTDPDVDGMLLRGFVTLLTEVEGTEAIGSPIFLSATNSGKATITAPSGDTNIVRVLGYSLHATENQVYFNPDNTFVEVTA